MIQGVQHRTGLRRFTGVFVLALVLSGSAFANVRSQEVRQGMIAGTPQAHNQLTAEEVAAGWKLLFDGKTTIGWRGYQRDSLGAGWQVVDGAFTRAARGGGDIVYGLEKFKNFELSIDWRLTAEGAAGNSGVFFRAIEDKEGPIYNFAPEIQLLDDARHADGRRELTSAGANYDMHPAPRGVVKPVGEWNTLRVVVNGNNVQHWLNGQKIVDYELLSPDWLQRKAASKWANMEFYGLAPEGYIGLQDHGSFVAFRNMKIRRLP
jgi:hypothetical protein